MEGLAVLASTAAECRDLQREMHETTAQSLEEEASTVPDWQGPLRADGPVAPAQLPAPALPCASERVQRQKGAALLAAIVSTAAPANQPEN